ncbi:putative BOI-related E3 ubiquitin-protein ligase 3 isoform X1 [Panicum miliaceum]|uniref:BOI-related E3 ubiquitin-protein ligase 3 isoform X1 n=1 Tax=Panicum miliaceum TaxID=4540 RepID=A0A3L6TKL8_PANMI|nr:putative BOI-related E3 ubiquitin-protein ligase 3 isoform X1 [Panicum miliaceum]
MGDLAVWVLSRGGGAPESSRMAAAMELQQGQKEAMALQQAPPLFLDFSHGGNLSKAPAWLCFCRISCLSALLSVRMARLTDGTDLFRCRGHADCGAGRKRQREAAAAPSMSPHLFSLQPQPQAQGPKVISLAQLHKRPAMGLRLDFDEGSEHVSSTSSASPSCLLSDELAAQRDQHRNEMDRLIQEHAERLQRALADARRRQYRSLLVAAEAAASQRIREKEAEASEAARRGADLEDRVARLRAEAAAWQAKALADQSTAAALHAQLQQAAAAAQARGRAEEEDNAGGAADDAGSCFVDPDRVVEIAPPPPPARPCRTCRRASASVVLLPCRHLCVCADCEPAGAVAAACPMCRGAVTGTVQVFFS